MRLTGANPSSRAAGAGGVTPLHPVESVSWDDATRALERVALSLPTEAQWEHACRAGSSTPYSFGGELAARGKMNMYDRTAIEAGVGGARRPDSMEHDDGAVYHAPVGTWPANAFGLHEVHGNVGEIVLDADPGVEYAADEPNVDPLTDPGENDSRIRRGGSFAVPAAVCRSYVRLGIMRSAAGAVTGVRPGRELPAPE
jgi:formylglycine-generating enzyme required for sulfatase activity